MTSKPKIYANCDAGCRWQTVHYDDFVKSAAFIRQTANGDGSYTLELGKEYKIYASVFSNNTWDCALIIAFASGGATQIEIPNRADKYADFFIFRLLECNTDGTNMSCVYEIGGVRFQDEQPCTDTEFLSLKAHGATDVLLYNSDARTIAQDGKSAYEIALEHGFEGTEEEWIESLNGGGGGNGGNDESENMPDYVIEEAESTISKLFSHGTLGRTIRFIAISDTHEDSKRSYNSQITISNKHAGQAIKYIADRIGLDFVAHLGDASSCGAWATTYEFDVLCNDVKQISKFVFSGVRGIKNVFIPGNHDMISMDGSSLLNSGAYTLFGNLCSGNKDRLGGYGYFDIDDANVRVVYLNTSDSPSSAAYLALTQAQKNWLCETLIDVNTKDNADEWKIILLSHAPLDFGGADISSDILIPYVNGGSYNDYAFTANSAKIISNIHGHVHCYSYGYIGDVIRRFTIPNACFIGANHYASRTEYADWVDATTYNKTANSGKDTAFSLVTIDLDSGMCYVDNYGAGIDREFSTEYSEPARVPVNEVWTSITDVGGDIFNKDSTPGYQLEKRLNSSGQLRDAAGCVVSGYAPYTGGDIEVILPTALTANSNTYIHVFFNAEGVYAVTLMQPDGTTLTGDRRQASVWVNDFGATRTIANGVQKIIIPKSIIPTNTEAIRISSVVDSGIEINDNTFSIKNII